MGGQPLEFGLFGFRLQPGNGFANKIPRHRSRPVPNNNASWPSMANDNNDQNRLWFQSYALMRCGVLHVRPEFLRGLMHVAQVDHIVDLDRAVDLLGVDEELPRHL